MESDTQPTPGTLGYHRAMCAAVFGETSAATKFLDEKIGTAERGAEEPVVIEESQLVMLLGQLHFRKEPPHAD